MEVTSIKDELVCHKRCNNRLADVVSKVVTSGVFLLLVNSVKLAFSIAVPIG